MAIKSYTVSEINGYIKNLLGSDYVLGDVNIKGEVSNCKYHSSGHIYFTIKDGASAIAAVMFRGNAMTGLSFKMKDGQQIIARGGINVYERDGKYQLYAKSITLDGTGNLYEEYERLKQKLYEQGLFEFDIKKPIPVFPKRVGIVTAKTGAAIQDIMNIAKRRNPYVQLILYPAKVQGEGAAKDIADGIETLDKMNLDTIIIGRGGGSIEDLWAFNEEIVAWAIYNAKTPIISGTGHEIDNTIADYVSDLRAPTPSAAAELAIPDIMSVIHGIDDIERKLYSSIMNKVSTYKDRINNLERQLGILNPKQKLLNGQQSIDEYSDRIKRAICLKLEACQRSLSDLDGAIDRAMKNKYQDRLHRLQLLTAKINGLSPTAKLINGFGYMEIDDKPVVSVKNVKQNDEIKITMHDGTIHGIVGGIDVREG